VRGARRAKEQRKEAAAQKCDVTRAKPCAATVPKTLSRVSPYGSRFPPEGGHGKPARVRSVDVYYPAICSLPKITATDTRSAEDMSVIDTYWI